MITKQGIGREVGGVGRVVGRGAWGAGGAGARGALVLAAVVAAVLVLAVPHRTTG